jgi:DNA-binding response OmpR family regulator
MSLKILLIEDDNNIRFLLEQYLKDLGHVVYSFVNADAASKFCRCLNGSSCADIIITDNHLPGTTGLEYIEGLLKKGCSGRVQNIAIASGNWSIEEFNRALDLGCKVLQKPFHLNELRIWIEECSIAIQSASEKKTEAINT